MDTKDNITPLPDVVTSIRLPRDVHARIKAIAAREQRSLSGEIRKMVDERLALDEPEAAA